MEVNFAEVKEQVDCLPISYYAKRRVGMSVDKEIPASMYVPVNNEITISFKQVAEGLANATDEENGYKETAIRSMVYHELSHAILTPSFLGLRYAYTNANRNVMNIFVINLGVFIFITN